jgi:hypothetical protein
MIAACVTGLVLISKANFMPSSDGEDHKKKKNLRKRAENARARGRNPGSVLTAEVTAMAPPWFLVRALKPTGEEVSSRLLLPLY